MVKHIPAGRLARSEESARLAVYLASEDADFFIGQVSRSRAAGSPVTRTGRPRARRRRTDGGVIIYHVAVNTADDYLTKRSRTARPTSSG